MIYSDNLLDLLHDAIFGTKNEVECDYDNRRVNYNTVGDTYYYIDTYTNDEVKSIMVCAKVCATADGKDKSFGYVEIYVEDDDIYTAIDYIVEHLDEINVSIDRQI